MPRFFVPALRNHRWGSVTSGNPRWPILLFTLPVLAYVAIRFLEVEITRLIIPLFPDEADKSFGFYQDFVRLCNREMLWLSFFLLMAWLLYAYVPLPALITQLNKRVQARSSLIAGLTIIVSLAVFVSVARFTLEAFPNSADEYVYVYQAETLHQGRLWNEVHPQGDLFLYSHIAQKDEKSVGRFPPGFPLLLSLPMLAGIPAFWLNPVLAAFALLMFYGLARRLYGTPVALWSLVILSCSSFFVFNAASYFSHMACLLFVVGFVFCLYLHLDERRVWPALAAGAFLGLIVITRYYNAVLILLPVLVYLLYRHRREMFRALSLIGLGTLPFVVFLFWYNYKITGNGLLPVTVWMDPREGLGFGVMGHSPVKAVEHLVRRVFLFLYWSSPGLFVLYLLFLFQKVRNKAERFLYPEDYFMVMLIIGYFFYHHIGGNQYGPRFWFEGLPFMVLFVVKKTFDTKARWAIALLVAGMVYTVVKMPYIVQREHRIVEERLDLYRLVREAGISNAVVMVDSHTGIVRPMGQLDLTRNGTDFDRDVLYALTWNDGTQRLMIHYPNRAFYRYVRDPEHPRGWLERIPRMP